MILSVKTSTSSYPVHILSGGLSLAGELFDLNRKCLVVTDENIPKEYVSAILSQISEPYVFCLTPGEDAKTLGSVEKMISFLLEKGFDRKSAVVALGGGVIGDLAGFVASIFQRGIDFYNIPTTLLSQVDSSIGGKVAVNFSGYKNMVGSFYPPKGVLIDPETLKTLPQRQVSNGLSEAVKMAMTFDEEFFSLFEKENVFDHLEEIIVKSLQWKKKVVEEDEKETGLRKVLNFGHTVGHAVEKKSFSEKAGLYHGECVALGMIPMSSPKAQERLIPVLKSLSLPTKMPCKAEELLEGISHDKKMAGENITAIFVDEIGTYRMEEMSFSDFSLNLKERLL